MFISTINIQYRLCYGTHITPRLMILVHMMKIASEAGDSLSVKASLIASLKVKQPSIK